MISPALFMIRMRWMLGSMPMRRIVVRIRSRWLRSMSASVLDLTASLSWFACRSTSASRLRLSDRLLKYAKIAIVTRAITPTAIVSFEPSVRKYFMRYRFGVTRLTDLPGCCAGQVLSSWQPEQVGLARNVLSS